MSSRSPASQDPCNEVLGDLGAKRGITVQKRVDALHRQALERGKAVQLLLATLCSGDRRPIIRISISCPLFSVIF